MLGLGRGRGWVNRRLTVQGKEGKEGKEGEGGKEGKGKEALTWASSNASNAIRLQSSSPNTSGSAFASRAAR